MGAHNYRLFWRGWEDDFPFPRRSTTHRCFWFTQGPHTLPFWSRSLGLQESAWVGEIPSILLPMKRSAIEFDKCFSIDNQVRWHLCCSSCFESVLCRWIINLAFYVFNSTASAKSWQLLSFESTCLVVSWPSQGSNNSKDRSAGGGKKSQQKDGCFISFKLYLDLSGKNDTTKVKTVPKVQVRDELVTCELSWAWTNGERINWTANPIGLVTSWAYFR